MEIIFHSYANKPNFHVKSFALSLAFVARFNAHGNVLIQTSRSICNISKFSSSVMVWGHLSFHDMYTRGGGGGMAQNR